MADTSGKSATISASSTLSAGRFVIDVRHNHFVVDASAPRGGSGEAPGAIELLITSLATCALAVIADEGTKAGFRNATYSVVVSATQDIADRTKFSMVEFEFEFTQIAKHDGDALIRIFTEVCPIYNTVARTTPIKIRLSAA